MLINYLNVTEELLISLPRISATHAADYEKKMGRGTSWFTLCIDIVIHHKLQIALNVLQKVNVTDKGL